MKLLMMKNFFHLLKAFSKNQLKVLYENGIISEEKLYLLLPKNQINFFQKIKTNSINDINTKIEDLYQLE